MRYLFLLAAAALLPACGNSVGGKTKIDNNFHPGVNPTAPTPAAPAVGIGSHTGIKLAPGTLRAVSSNYALEATITTNDQLLTSPSASARISLNKPNPR